MQISSTDTKTMQPFPPPCGGLHDCPNTPGCNSCTIGRDALMLESCNDWILSTKLDMIHLSNFRGMFKRLSVHLNRGLCSCKLNIHREFHPSVSIWLFVKDLKMLKDALPSPALKVQEIVFGSGEGDRSRTMDKHSQYLLGASFPTEDLDYKLWWETDTICSSVSQIFSKI